MARKPRLRISANISALFTEQDLPDRIAAAADAGFNGVEVPLPYDYPAPDLRDKAIFAGICFARIDGPPPNYTGGPQGYAATPGLEARFKRDFARTVRQAQVLGVTRLHLRSGLEAPSDPATLIDNLRWAARETPKLMLLVEPLNPIDHADHCLALLADACAVVDAVQSPNLKLLFSTWHAARQEDGLTKCWQLAESRAGHVLLGGGRAKSSTHGAADFLPLLRDSGYAGWACADYAPATTTRETLGWMGQALA